MNTPWLRAFRRSGHMQVCRSTQSLNGACRRWERDAARGALPSNLERATTPLLWGLQALAARAPHPASLPQAALSDYEAEIVDNDLDEDTVCGFQPCFRVFQSPFERTPTGSGCSGQRLCRSGTVMSGLVSALGEVLASLSCW